MTDDTVTISAKNNYFASEMKGNFTGAISKASGVPKVEIGLREDGR